MYEERGVIKNRDRQRQIHDFSKLKRLRNITPTDIDGLIDYEGKHFIYLEGKVRGNDLFYGQRLALENAIKSHCNAGHPSIAIVYEHWIPSYMDVDVAMCNVSKIYSFRNGDFSWQSAEGNCNVLDLVDYFEELYKIV